MKLEKYVDKNKKRKKIMLISITVIVMVSITFLLYKTFASFTENIEFSIMKGQVDYFGNSDVYFAFYQGDKELEEMPQKDNEEDLVFDYGECDNDTYILWDNDSWAPLVKNLSNSKTKCSIYFQKRKYLQYGEINIPITSSGDGLYEVSHEASEELDPEWNKTEYRYAGSNPNNYISFNNEIWRIIGLVNVKIENGIDQRIKIVRADGIENQKDFGEYVWSQDNINNWETSSIKNMLNGIYYESTSGTCWTGDNNTTASQGICDFSGNGSQPKGIEKEFQSMIDKDVIWNLGGYSTSEIITKKMYEKERGIEVYNNNPTEWSEISSKNDFNGIGLMYSTDYGYAVGGIERSKCINNYLNAYEKNICYKNNWLLNNNDQWLITPNSAFEYYSFCVSSSGLVGSRFTISLTHGVWPTLYLKSNIKIEDDSGDNYGSIDNPFRIRSE